MSPLEDEELEALIALLRSDSSRGEGDLYRRALEQFDRVIVSHVMDQAGGNLTKAAERLGLSRRDPSIEVAGNAARRAKSDYAAGRRAMLLIFLVLRPGSRAIGADTR